jgi:hypothetical protein
LQWDAEFAALASIFANKKRIHNSLTHSISVGLLTLMTHRNKLLLQKTAGNLKISDAFVFFTLGL